DSQPCLESNTQRKVGSLVYPFRGTQCDCEPKRTAARRFTLGSKSMPSARRAARALEQATNPQKRKRCTAVQRYLERVLPGGLGPRKGRPRHRLVTIATEVEPPQSVAWVP